MFARRSFQWVAISNKLGRYQNVRELIARLYASFAECLPESISNEIKTDASTLLQSGAAFPELAHYFIPSSFDQIFLDEIDVIEVLPDLKEMLISPKETFSHEQLMRLEIKKRQQVALSEETESDVESLQLFDKELITNEDQFLYSNYNYLYWLVILLVIIVILLIIS